MRSEAKNPWPIRCLTDVLTLPMGQVDPRIEPYRNYVLLAPDHVESGTGRIIKKETAEKQGAISGKYLVQPGDVVFSKIRPALRKVALADFSGICSADMYPLRPGKEILGRFLISLLLGEKFSRYVESLSGRTGIPKVNRADLAGFFFKLPPLEEQQRIVAIIDKVWEHEHAITASITKLGAVRSGVITKLLEAEHGTFEWLPVREVGEVRMGKQLSPLSQAASGRFPYLRVANVLRGRIDYTDVKTMGFSKRERRIFGLKPGDIMLNEGQSLDLVGRSAIYSGIEGEFCFQNTLVRFRPGGRILSEYAQLIFERWLDFGVFAGIAKQTTSIAHLGGERFAALSFPLLSLAKQRHIVEVISAVSEQKRSLELELVKHGKLRQGIVDDLLSKRVRV